jgi:hypothetical protein
MTAAESDSQFSWDPLITALERIATSARSNISKPHQYHFVSALQARPAQVAYHRWSASGQIGPEPIVPRAAIRAMIYDISRTAGELSAFCKVVSLVTVEFAEAAANAFRRGNIVLGCAALRCLIERIAHAAAIANALNGVTHIPLPSKAPLNPILEVAGIIRKALYGTQREWADLTKVDFRSSSPKDVVYRKKEDTADVSAVNVLNDVDKLTKQVAGARFIYEILCEFLHPNVGDLFGSSLRGSDGWDNHGTRHLTRTIGFGPKIFSGFPDMQLIMKEVAEISIEIVEVGLRILPGLESTATYVVRVTRKNQHQILGKYRRFFRNSDLCPCLSGFSVKDCGRAKLIRRP